MTASFDLSKPIRAVTLVSPDMGAISQWGSADLTFDPYKLLCDDKNGAYLLVNSAEKAEICISSLRRAIKAINDKRKCVWLSNLLRTLESVRKNEPIWINQTTEITLRIQHDQLRTDYRQFIKNVFAGADGQKIDRPCLVDLQRRTKRKFKLPALPPASLMSEIVEELNAEELAKRDSDLTKKAAREKAEEIKNKYEVMLAEMKSKLDKIQSQSQAVENQVMKYQPILIKVPDLKTFFNTSDSTYSFQEEIAVRNIKTVAITSDPEKGTFAFALMNDGTMLPLCKPVKNRFRADKVQRFVTELKSLPMLDIVEVPQPDDVLQ